MVSYTDFQARIWPGVLTPEMLKVTFLNRVNPLTFSVGVGYGHWEEDCLGIG